MAMLALGLLTLFGLVSVWARDRRRVLHGGSRAFEMPSRQSLVSSAVDSKLVVNAVGMNSVVFNVAADRRVRSSRRS